MKKKIFLGLLLLLFFACVNVNAESCSYKEQADLNSEVAQIKVKYEEKVGLVDPSTYTCHEEAESCEVQYNYFGITILNMSENFYIEVTDNSKTKTKYTYDDVKDGVITFDYQDIDVMNNYTFKVYASYKTNCSDELYRTIYLTTPRFNKFYYEPQCAKYPEHYLCQKYVTTKDDVEWSKFGSIMHEYQTKKETEAEAQNHNFLEKIYDFIDSHKLLLTITTVVVVAGVATVVIIKKRKERI